MRSHLLNRRDIQWIFQCDSKKFVLWLRLKMWQPCEPVNAMEILLSAISLIFRTVCQNTGFSNQCLIFFISFRSSYLFSFLSFVQKSCILSVFSVSHNALAKRQEKLNTFTRSNVVFWNDKQSCCSFLGLAISFAWALRWRPFLVSWNAGRGHTGLFNCFFALVNPSQNHLLHKNCVASWQMLHGQAEPESFLVHKNCIASW